MAIDNEKDSHHALQLSVDDNVVCNDQDVIFYHSGRIAVGSSNNNGNASLTDLIVNAVDLFLIALTAEAAGGTQGHIDHVNTQNHAVFQCGKDPAADCSVHNVGEDLHRDQLSIGGHTGDDVIVTAVCDVYEDRIERAQKFCKDKKDWDVAGTTNYRELIERDDVDVVFVFSAWENHIPAAIYAMDHGKQVGIEVGGAYSIDELYELVKKCI